MYIFFISVKVLLYTEWGEGSVLLAARTLLSSSCFLLAWMCPHAFLDDLEGILALGDFEQLQRDLLV